MSKSPKVANESSNLEPSNPPAPPSASPEQDRPSEVIIRNLTIDDLAPVFHLGETLFLSQLYPSLYRTWDQWEVTGLYNTDSDYCLVAEVAGEFAGFLLGTVIDKDRRTYGYIVWLGVNPQFQRQGVADRLVDRFIGRTIRQGAQMVVMDTDPANEPAVKFFTRKGFGNTRQHVFMTLDLAAHEYYGRLIEYERDRAEN